jgi:hypothetical protein
VRGRRWASRRVAGGDALLGVVAAVVVVRRGLPLDRHDLQRGEEQRGLQAALVGEAWDVPGDLDGDAIGGDAARRVRRRDDEPRGPPMSAERKTLELPRGTSPLHPQARRAVRRHAGAARSYSRAA